MEKSKFAMGFAYDGTEFSAFSTQSSGITVEGEIKKVLISTGAATGMRTASRTDRNVSATFNVLTVETSFEPLKVMGMLNSSLKHIYFHSYAPVDKKFNVRHCTEKEYTYLLPYKWVDPGNFLKEMKKFEGIHDFRNFCRYDSKGTTRELRKVSLVSWRDIPAIKFTARGFLWNQIRFMVGYGIQRLRDGIGPEDPWDEKGWARFIAPPELLILTDVRYDGINMIPVHKKSLTRDVEKEKVIRSARHFLIDEIQGKLI